MPDGIRLEQSGRPLEYIQPAKNSAKAATLRISRDRFSGFDINTIPQRFHRFAILKSKVIFIGDILKEVFRASKLNLTFYCLL